MGTLIRTGGDWNWLTMLPEEVFAAIDAHCVPRQLRAGENVYRREEASDALFQVVKGRVQIRNYSASGKELLYTYMEPGDCFGELGLIDGESRHHDVDADGEAELAVLLSTDFSRLREQYRDIDHQLMVLMSRRTRRLYEIYEEAFLLDLPRRLAQRLHTIGGSVARTVEEEAPPALVISHEDLARMVGASRQSVTSILKNWERQGLLRQAYGKIVLLDLDALRQFAES